MLSMIGYYNFLVTVSRPSEDFWGQMNTCKKHNSFCFLETSFKHFCKDSYFLALPILLILKICIHGSFSFLYTIRGKVFAIQRT